MTDLRVALRARLTAALKDRDRLAVDALRSVIGELDNAEAIDVPDLQTTSGEYFAGGAVGVGAAEADRHELSPTEQHALVVEQVRARDSAAADYEQRGQDAAAGRLRREAEILTTAIADLEPDVGPDVEPVVGTERAVYGAITSTQLRSFLDSWARDRLGAPISSVRFRSGRIDVVWGVELADGRRVVIKTHRPPVDRGPLGAAVEAQRVLTAAGFPCAIPLAGPDEVEGRVLTAETLIDGELPNGRDPELRRALAAGLARHIEILGGRPELVRGAGPGPSWCRYQAGPWPVPHDALVDFASTRPGFGWLDDFGRRAADQILAHRDPNAVVVGHADWYAGNVLVSGAQLVGTVDWELVADTEAVIAGFAAACFGASSTGGGGLSTPDEVANFLTDYDAVRPQPLATSERRAAAAAAAWILAFNARWQVGLIEHGLCDDTPVALVRERGEEYLALDW